MAIQFMLGFSNLVFTQTHNYLSFRPFKIYILFLKVLYYIMKNVILSFLFLFLSFPVSFSQPPKRYPAGELQLAINKLNVLGSVLYVAAHPDDENTRLISWLANNKLYNTGYISLTRGDGGQNLIGPEIWEQLGIIRTQELLQARRVDGGKQFFSRANDFGFSKHPDETFTIWDKEQVLADLVWTIRKFKPDVIITRFSLEPGATHGHHTASAILAREAFDAAADPNRFPEQLSYVSVWQARRILWNTSSFFYTRNDMQFDETGKLKIDVGDYSPLLGKSMTEIAAESRSMHKSQGFGSSGVRGTTYEYFEHLAGDKAENALLEKINTSWNRVEGGKAVGKLLEKAKKEFNPANPGASVPVLLKALSALNNLPDGYWKQTKLEDLKAVIKGCLGLHLEAITREFTITPGQTAVVSIEAVNRSAVPVILNKVTYSLTSLDTTLQTSLNNNQVLEYIAKITVPENTLISQPYWLRTKGTKGMFTVENQELTGLPENPADAKVVFSLTVNGVPLEYSVPVMYKKTDPVDGEIYRPFEVIPPVLVRAADQVLVFADNKPRVIRAMVQAGQDNIAGNLQLTLPEGWRSEPATAPFKVQHKGEELTVLFKIFPPAKSSEGELGVVAEVDGKSFTKSIVAINYPHIPSQVVFPEATSKIVRLDLTKNGENIGYITGAGDEIPESLRQIGYNVNILAESEITADNLKRFDAIILGVRALNTNDRIKFYMPRLLEYVKTGGNVIVQYNTSHALVTEEIGPYTLKLSRDRVTVEEAEVRFLKPEHEVLNSPNKITKADFEGWVQERGLYFPSEWSSEYEAILSSNDPGETPKDGGLLVAKYGEGHFVYTGYSWFRQLPAGVPGAYRIFTNLISIGKK